MQWENDQGARWYHVIVEVEDCLLSPCFSCSKIENRKFFDQIFWAINSVFWLPIRNRLFQKNVSTGSVWMTTTDTAKGFVTRNPKLRSISRRAEFWTVFLRISVSSPSCIRTSPEKSDPIGRFQKWLLTQNAQYDKSNCPHFYLTFLNSRT